MKIKEFCIINNSTISPKVDCEILYLDTSSITNNEIEGYQSFMLFKAPSRAQRKVQDKTILYSCVRPNLRHFGILKNPPSNLVVSTGFATLDVKDECVVDPYYLYYWLSQESITNTLHTIAQNAVSSYPSINPSDIGDLEIDLPPINIQRKIGAFLDSLDRKISLNRSINEELERMAKDIYDYWFVQFDFPDEHGRPYKSSGGAMVYNPVLKREVPEGWEVKSLKEIATFTNGLACQKFRPTDENKLPVIKIREMHGGFSADTEFVKSNIPEKVKVYNGDVLFSWSASLEVMLWAYGNGGLNQHIFKVTSNNGWPKSFYYYQLLSYVDVFKKMAEARKTTMGHITEEHLEQSRIIVPNSVALAEQLESKIAPIFDKIVATSEEITLLQNQRDELLPLLMTGQVKIK